MRVFWFLLILIPSYASSQSTEMFNSNTDTITFIQDFNEGVELIREHLKETLTPKQLKLLRATEVLLDTNLALDITSDSKKRTITFNLGILKSLIFFTVSEEVGKDMVTRRFFLEENMAGGDTIVDYNRKNFTEFYKQFLRFLQPSVDPEAHLELNEMQKEGLSFAKSFRNFRAQVQKSFILIFLHEFYHQEQKITKKMKRFDKNGGITFKKKMLRLEMEADSFVFEQSQKLRILPDNYLRVLNYLMVVRENKYPTELDIIERQKNYARFFIKSCNTEYLGVRYNCKSAEELYQSTKLELEFYEANTNSLRKLISEKEKLDINDCFENFRIGKAYLVGNDFLAKNIDSALYYFNTVSDSNTDSLAKRNRRKNIPPKSYKLTVEKASLYAGKIYELIYSNKKKALHFYKKAQSFSTFLPREYYESLFERLNRE